MTDVVQSLQAIPGNTINSGVSTAGLSAALGSARFPADSTLRPGKGVGLNRPWYVPDVDAATDRFSQAVATTLEALIAARAASAVSLPSPNGTLSLTVGETSSKNVRAAFTSTTSPTTGTVQYYECDLNAAQTVASNCAATTTGTYTIVTVNGARVLTFGDVPPTTASNLERAFAEIRADRQVNAVTPAGDWVYRVSRLKPALSVNTSESTRLNGVAWTAMRTQLGL